MAPRTLPPDPLQGFWDMIGSGLGQVGQGLATGRPTWTDKPDMGYGPQVPPPTADAFGTGMGPDAYSLPPVLPPVDPGGLQGAVPSLGASLEPSRPDMGYGPQQLPSQAAPQAQAATAAVGPKNPLLDALRGVQAPTRPDVVKPNTPSLPQPRPIQAGQLLQLLQELSNPRAAAARPTTLGASLGTGRY